LLRCDFCIASKTIVELPLRGGGPKANENGPRSLLRGPFCLVAGQDSNLRPLGYEPTGSGLAWPPGSQTCRSRSTARPSHHGASHVISAVAPRFVHKSVHNLRRQLPSATGRRRCCSASKPARTAHRRGSTRRGRSPRTPPAATNGSLETSCGGDRTADRWCVARKDRRVEFWSAHSARFASAASLTTPSRSVETQLSERTGSRGKADNHSRHAQARTMSSSKSPFTTSLVDTIA
jgi:hypothetical protein